ncbi:PilZ domain protein [Methyloligella halotolerans]|uniref:PilZ domain protein n=1 Tax=Methyloligella halotolerans TaxID=1177755 RepID=A0A1E2S1I9_9HYPH|nr:PilZ domain-containing protein [Methyloligella halotolerans]ODA68208.1 PilZ domain protein [Methyloligella halotolerans]
MISARNTEEAFYDQTSKSKTDENPTDPGNRIPPKIVDDRRQYRRVDVRIFGRFMREDKQEFPCRIINMSAGGMAMLAPVACEQGERIVAYLDNFGRIEGKVVRCFEGGFAIEITASAVRREKIANLLTWAVNQENLGLSSETRVHERKVPNKPESKLILPDGQTQECRVIDVSLSGASVAVDPRPALGTVVVLGRMRGFVVRQHDDGVAIQFASVQNPDSIAQSFG